MYSISLCVERNDQDNSIETDIEIYKIMQKKLEGKIYYIATTINSYDFYY